MIALQVQDITAQQIAGVNRLMQSVDDGLNALLRHVQGEESAAGPDRSRHRDVKIAFDPSAEYDTTATKQQKADSIINDLRQQTK